MIFNIIIIICKTENQSAQVSSSIKMKKADRSLYLNYCIKLKIYRMASVTFISVLFVLAQMMRASYIFILSSLIGK